uniref:Uncharacterized protein n=1 Tax=Panagrolaimus sp. PS1159 TaxID=55785 RepID=A0AC35F6X6_9BILA
MFKEERRKVLKSQRIDESIKININLQQPPTTTTTTFESSISLLTKDIKELRKTVENQNLQIQSKNDEIILLKQTIQSQQENHVFFFNSNAKIWLTLNNLEKQISSNSKYSESNESKEITFLDIKKYLQKNPKEAADVERIAKDVKYSLEKNLSVLNESNSKSENLLRKRNHKRQRRMGEKSYKQKNVDDFVKSTTIDEKLETFGISNTKNIFRRRRSLSPKNIRNSFIDIEVTVMPDQFDDNADWSSLEKNESEKEKEKHVSHRHSRLSPTNSIINVLTTSPFAYN